MKKFELIEEFKKYLERGNMIEEKMHPVQLCETRRAFMAGCGSTLILLRNEVSQLSDEEGVKSLDDILKQIQKFWDDEVKDNDLKKSKLN